MTTATLQPAVLAFTMGLAVVTGLVFGLVPALVVLRGNTLVAAQGRQHARLGGTEHRPHAVDARHRRDGVRARAARRRRPAAQELHAAAERRSGFCHRQRADGADVAAGRRAIPTPPRAARSGCGWSKRRARCPASRPSGLTSNVPFNGSVSSGSYSIVGYTPGPSEAATARAPGSGRRRLLRRDAHSAHRGPLLQRRRHRRQPARRRRRSVSREQVLRRAQRHRPADSARRPRQPAHHDRRRRRARSTASTSASR